MNAPRVPAGRLRIGLAVAATLLASACAAGQQAQTANEKPTIDGSNADAGGIALRALAIAAPVSTSYAPGSSAQLTGVLVNNTSHPDTLTSVTSQAVTGWGSYGSSQPAATPTGKKTKSSATSAPTSSQAVVIPPGARVSYGVPESQKVLKLTGLKQRLFPGQSIKITFVFQKAGAVSVVVPVALSDQPGSLTVGDTGAPANG